MKIQPCNNQVCSQPTGQAGINTQFEECDQCSSRAFCPQTKHKQPTTPDCLMPICCATILDQSFDIATYTQHLTFLISTILVSQPTEMGSILSKHIEQAQPNIFENTDTENSEDDDIPFNLHIFSRIGIPIITIESDDDSS